MFSSRKDRGPTGKNQAELIHEGLQKVKDQLEENEELRMYSSRKPKYATGVACIVMGLLFIWQQVRYYLLSDPLWAVPILLLSIVMVWAGVWIVIFSKGEYVFVTDCRIVHQKVTLLGKLANPPVSIPFSEVTRTTLLRRAATLKPASRMAGDILVKKNRRSYLLPTTHEGYLMAEILIAEVQNYNNLHDEDEENEEED